MGTVFEAVDAIGCALGEPLEPTLPPLLPLPELPLLLELLLESPPPPQAARNTDRLSTARHRARPDFKEKMDDENVGRMIEVSVRYWMSLALTPAGKACGR
jgi:hypothetical protein